MAGRYAVTTTSAVSCDARMRFPSGTFRRAISFCNCVRKADGDGSPPVPFSPVTSPTPRSVMTVLPWTLMYSDNSGVLILVPKSLSSSSSSFDFDVFFLSLSSASLDSLSLSLPKRSASIPAPGMLIKPAAQPQRNVDVKRQMTDMTRLNLRADLPRQSLV